MAKDKPEPVFVNLQRSVVQVYNEGRRPIRVAPWKDRNRGQAATFEVKGEHYRQFVSAKGPLFPRPAGAESAAPAPDKDAAAGDKTVSGDKTPAADAGGAKTKEPKTPEAAKDLRGYTVDGAVEQIAVVKDKDLLAAWAKAEAKGDDRKGVKEAIEKRLVELAE